MYQSPYLYSSHTIAKYGQNTKRNIPCKGVKKFNSTFFSKSLYIIETPSKKYKKIDRMIKIIVILIILCVVGFFIMDSFPLFQIRPGEKSFF
jgi:inner membrane protein involved in colicin E2 resistance